MNLHAQITDNQSEVIGHIGWKYYNQIKKKAMEQEFSWSGLLLSLSIAFFIVIVTALLLSLFYQSWENANFREKVYNNHFYRLEASLNITPENYLNIEYMDNNKLSELEIVVTA